MMYLLIFHFPGTLHVRTSKIKLPFLLVISVPRPRPPQTLHGEGRGRLTASPKRAKLQRSSNRPGRAGTLCTRGTKRPGTAGSTCRAWG